MSKHPHDPQDRPARKPEPEKPLHEAAVEETGNEDPGAELSEIINRKPPARPGPRDRPAGPETPAHPAGGRNSGG